MSKRKYSYFTVVADFGTVDEQYEDYNEAFCKYQRQDAPKTMYGHDEQGSISVIFSEG